MPDYAIRESVYVYDPRFISVDEIAQRLFLMRVYPDAATVDAVKKNIENHIRRNNLPAVKFLPGFPGEQCTKSRAPWCIDRATAEAWISQEVRAAVEKRTTD